MVQCKCTAQWQRINDAPTTHPRRHDDDTTTRRRRGSKTKRTQVQPQTPTINGNPSLRIREQTCFCTNRIRPCESGYELQQADLRSVYCSVKVAKLHELYIPTHPFFLSFNVNAFFGQVLRPCILFMHFGHVYGIIIK